MYEPTEAGAFFPGVLNAYDDGAVLAFLDSVLFRLRWIAFGKIVCRVRIEVAVWMCSVGIRSLG